LHAGIGERLRLQRGRWAVLALLCLTLVFAAMLDMRNLGMLSLLALCPLAATFLWIVCAGNRLFGVLAWPASRRLSGLSYGIYLGQGLALLAVFAIPGVKAYAMSGTLAFWLVNSVCALVLVTGALAIHLWIEEPGIRMGRRWARRLRARSDTLVPLASTG